MALFAWSVGSQARKQILRERSAWSLKTIIDLAVMAQIKRRQEAGIAGVIGFNRVPFDGNEYNIIISNATGRVDCPFFRDREDLLEVTKFKSFLAESLGAMWLSVNDIHNLTVGELVVGSLLLKPYERFRRVSQCKRASFAILKSLCDLIRLWLPGLSKEAPLRTEHGAEFAKGETSTGRKILIHKALSRHQEAPGVSANIKAKIRKEALL